VGAPARQNSIEEVIFETVALKQDAANLCLRGQRGNQKPDEEKEGWKTTHRKISVVRVVGTSPRWWPAHPCMG